MTVEFVESNPSLRVPQQPLLTTLTWSVATYCVGLGVMAVLGVGAPSSWQVPLYAAGGLALLVFWSKVRFADQVSRYFSFGAAFLLAGALNRVLYLGDFLQVGERFHESPVYSSNPEQAMIVGEVLTIGGTLVTCAAWVWAGGAKYAPGMIFSAKGSEVIRILSLTYVCSLFGIAVSALSTAVLQALGQLLPVMSGLGSAASYVLPSVWSHRPKVRLLIAGAMSVPFVVFALGSGMKENIILSLLPAAVFLWQALRVFWMRVALAVSAMALVALITAYVGYYRTEVWVGKSDSDTSEVLDSFQEEMSQDVGGTLSKGIETFLIRANASLHRGWAVEFAEQHGFSPELVFAPLTYVFIPRVIWPEKPAIQQGGEYRVMLFGGTEDSGSSMAAGFYTSLYLGGGWLPALLGALAVGLMMAGLARLAFKLGGPLLAGLYGFAIIPYALRLDDSWSVGALSGPIVQFAYIAAIFFMNRGLLAFLPAKKVTE